MDLETAGPRVAFVTAAERAGEGFLARVGQLMGLQVALRDELALADVAGEGTLACVGPHVGFEVSSLSEFFQTELVRANQDL